MKKYIIIIGLFLLPILLFSQNTSRTETIRNFYENPFITENIFPNIFHFYQGYDDLHNRL